MGSYAIDVSFQKDQSSFFQSTDDIVALFSQANWIKFTETSQHFKRYFSDFFILSD
jgi:hypothetical protein